MGEAPRHGEELSSRTVFALVAGAVLVVAFVAFVVQPAVSRGGAGELLLIIAFFGAVLLFERWLRTR